MSKKVTFDAKGHEAILDALRGEFDLVVAPRGQYIRILRNGKLAGWLTATKKHVRVRIGGGTKEAVNVSTAAQAKAVMKKLAAKVPASAPKPGK
jgi:hypothetical protein